MNRKIIIAVVVIGGAGIVGDIMAQKPLTPVILGSYIFLFVLSIMDIFGGPFSNLAGALAMVAVVYVLFGTDPTTGSSIFPWQEIIRIAQGGPAPDPHAGPSVPCTASAPPDSTHANSWTATGTTGTCVPGFCNITGVGCIPALTINGKPA